MPDYNWTHTCQNKIHVLFDFLIHVQCTILLINKNINYSNVLKTKPSFSLDFILQILFLSTFPLNADMEYIQFPWETCIRYFNIAFDVFFNVPALIQWLPTNHHVHTLIIRFIIIIITKSFIIIIIIIIILVRDRYFYYCQSNYMYYNTEPTTI
jgi:hypothetical protein